MADLRVALDESCHYLINDLEGHLRAIGQVFDQLERIGREREPIIPRRYPDVLSSVGSAQHWQVGERIALTVTKPLRCSAALVRQSPQLPAIRVFIDLSPKLLLRPRNLRDGASSPLQHVDSPSSVNEECIAE